MSLLSRLFGNRSTAEPPAANVEEYNGFRIIPAPMADGKTWRIGAWIEREVDGALKRHHLIRADTLQGRDEAEAASVAKAKVMIDQMGVRLFADPQGQ